jgi:NADH:ubiquinone oxidoreductase subunit H
MSYPAYIVAPILIVVAIAVPNLIMLWLERKARAEKRPSAKEE